MNEERQAFRATALKHWSQLEHFVIAANNREEAIEASQKLVASLSPEDTLLCLVGLRDIMDSMKSVSGYINSFMMDRILDGDGPVFIAAAEKLRVELEV